MLLSIHTYSALLSLSMSLATCGPHDGAVPTVGDAEYEYDLSKPDKQLRLPGRLKEISGLTVVDGHLLAAIQDEKGEIYLIDPTDGDVVDEFKFEKKGDYEGIELVDDTLYVLRSDGDLFVVSDWRSKDRKTEKIETYLASKNDTEGLGYQASKHRLLVAAKEFPGRGRSRVRSIYGFDLQTKKIDHEPAYVIPLDTIGVRLGLPGESIRNLLAPVVDLEVFKPSALAVHPQTGDIFVLSSVLKVIAVLDASGSTLRLLPIGAEELVQPEGLAFYPNGDLFISTEGRGGDGKILRFNQRNAAE
ncbi:MAG: SdiA-regulated domain-containing protein [Rhodothermales bacterium]